MTCKVLVAGAGAIGAFYGALLAKAGCEVSVLCRSGFEAVKQHGFQIISHDLGQWQFMPDQVLQNAADYQGNPDYILVCTKVIPEIDRAALIEPAVKANTAIVLVQNGIAIEKDMQTAFPWHEIISGLAFICCNQTSPGVIHHLAYGRLMLGNWPVSASEKTLQLSQWFNQAGIECTTTENIVAGRWQKCVWNAPFNPLSVLSGGLPTLAILQTQEAFVRAVMQEVFDTAKALGYTLPSDIIDSNIERTYNMPPYKTSMLLDFEHGRPMETEAILGNAVRAAQSIGQPCPRLQSLYALMQLRELQLNYLP